MGCKCLLEKMTALWGVLDLMTVFLGDAPGYSHFFTLEGKTVGCSNADLTFLPESTTFHSKSKQFYRKIKKLQDANVLGLGLRLFPNVGWASGCWNSVPATHTHTQAALRCHLLQLPCLNLTVCLLNNCVCFVWVLFCLHACLASVYLLPSCQSVNSARSGKEKGGMWWWRGGRDHTHRGDPGGRGVMEEGGRVRRLTCHPAARRFLASLNSAYKHMSQR